MPSALKKSSSGERFSRGTLKCAAARERISSNVLSAVCINIDSNLSKLWQAEPSQLIGDDQIARQGQFEAASERNPMDRRDGGERRRVERVHDGVDSPQILPGMLGDL